MQTVIGLYICLFISTLTWASEPVVRVRLLKGETLLKVSGYGLSVSGVDNKADTSNFRFGGELLKANRFKISLEKTPNGPKWIVLDPRTGQEHHFLGRTIRLFGDFLQVRHDKHIPSGSYLIYRKGNSFDVVAALPMEEYLLGVLPAEMPLAWPMEAIKAQAVASRSYTASLMKERRTYHFDVESTVADQVFSLSKHIGAQDVYQRKAKQAVTETRGEVISFGNHKIYRAYYHADSGGRTESSKYVWGPGLDQPSQSVLSPYPKSPYGLWEVSFSKIYLEKLLQEKLGYIEPLREFKIFKKSPSGRVLKLSVQLGENNHLISAHEFRKLVGFLSLKSTRFEIYEKGVKYWFSGSGFGHGVGMCQWGARHLAKRGLDYKQILEHYYPRTKIHRLFNEPDRLYQPVRFGPMESLRIENKEAVF